MNKICIENYKYNRESIYVSKICIEIYKYIKSDRGLNCVTKIIELT